MSGVRNITVPWVPLDEFDWSFRRSGPLPWNLTVWALLAVFTALPIWTTAELTVWVFYTFKRYRGVYFYSVLFTTWGVTLHAIGFILKYCVPEANWILATVLAEIGWVSMVSGFSVVLWSRLHLVSIDSRTLKVVLAMIIVDGCLFHIPTIVFQFLVSNKPTHAKFLPYMEPMERVQVMAFSVQETIISAIYVYGTLRLLRNSLNPKMRKTMAVLILIQIIVILADVLVITLDYLEYFQLKAVMHSFVYAFKLQLEFVILNEFRERVAKNGLAGRGFSSSSNLRDVEASSDTDSPSTSATKVGSGSAPSNKTKWFATPVPNLNTSTTPGQHIVHTDNATIYASTITIQQSPPFEQKPLSYPLSPSQQNVNAQHTPVIVQPTEAPRKSSAPHIDMAPSDALFSGFSDSTLPYLLPHYLSGETEVDERGREVETTGNRGEVPSRSVSPIGTAQFLTNPAAFGPMGESLGDLRRGGNIGDIRRLSNDEAEIERQYLGTYGRAQYEYL